MGGPCVSLQEKLHRKKAESQQEVKQINNKNAFQ